MEKFLNSESVIKIAFDLIPEDIQKKCEKQVLGETLTLKDQFICYWNSNEFKDTRYKCEEDLKKAILYCWSEYWNEQNICVFDDLFI